MIRSVKMTSKYRKLHLCITMSNMPWSNVPVLEIANQSCLLHVRFCRTWSLFVLVIRTFPSLTLQREALVTLLFIFLLSRNYCYYPSTKKYVFCPTQLLCCDRMFSLISTTRKVGFLINKIYWVNPQ